MQLDDSSIAAFEQLMERLERKGITLLRRNQHTWIESLESHIANAKNICSMITAWENRWYQRNLVDRDPDGVSERIKATLEKAEAMPPENYQALLLKRDHVRTVYASLSSLADAIITLACPGPAPLWAGDILGQPSAPWPTGDPVFNYPSSMIGAPVVTIPMMAVNHMPLGVQIMGQLGEDARITSLARWVYENIEPTVTR